MQNKKQLFELFEGICHINEKVWGNHAGSYEDEKESAYQIEEALEGFNLTWLHRDLGMENRDENNEVNAKDVSRDIMESVMEYNITIADVDRFDKALDAIYFAIGSMHKLGLSPHNIVEGLAIVHQANLQKTGKKDSEGKVGKPADFVPPEELLQLILDKRG